MHHIRANKLERARELRREMTPAEKVLWQAVRTNKLAGMHFRRQQVLCGFIVDFYCHAARLAVELDGQVHEQQQGYDAERSEVLAREGIEVIRFRNEEVLAELPRVLRVIRERCEGPNPPAPFPAREGGVT